VTTTSPVAPATSRGRPDQRSPGRPHPRRGSGAREGRAAWVLAIPFCLLFLAFTAWPVIQSLFMSFTDTRSKDLRNPFGVDVVGWTTKPAP